MPRHHRRSTPRWFSAVAQSSLARHPHPSRPNSNACGRSRTAVASESRVGVARGSPDAQQRIHGGNEEMNRSVLHLLLGLALTVSTTWNTANAEGIKQEKSEKAEAVASTVDRERKEFIAAAEEDLKKLNAELRELKQKAAAKTR